MGDAFIQQWSIKSSILYFSKRIDIDYIESENLSSGLYNDSREDRIKERPINQYWTRALFGAYAFQRNGQIR